MDQQLLVMFCIAGAVGLVAFALSKLFLGKQNDEKLRDRLSQKDGAAQLAVAATAGPRPGLMPMLSKLGQAASKPFTPNDREKVGSLRQKLARAGIYQPSAVQVVTGAKVIFMALGVLGGYLLGSAAGGMMLLLGLSVGGLAGYMGPTIWLN